MTEVDVETLKREGMKGRNEQRPLTRDDGQILQVHHMFWTVQGEGPLSGHAALFIRLSGCNLACTFCDTYWADEHDPWLTLDSIITKVKELHESPRLFVLTGGEPTRQNITPLVDRLLAEFPTCRVQIETHGMIWRDCMEYAGVVTVVSPKTSTVNRQVAIAADAFKYVLKSTDDVNEFGVPIADTQGTGRMRALAQRPPGTPVYVTPCDEQDPVKNAANGQRVVEFAQRFGYIAQIQIHKYLGVE